MARNWEHTLPANWQTDIPNDYWNTKLQRARTLPPAGLLLEQDVSSSLPVFLTPALLSTHLHCVGSTGVGKSFMIEAILKSLILQGHGVVLIDPHGDLYHRLIGFCAWLSLRKPELQLHRRVVPFDVAETQNVIGFNPIARNSRVMTYQVVALMEAIRKCWSQASFDATPRLARWLFNVAYALVSANVTLVQAQDLVNAAPSLVRAAITARIANPRIRAEWEWLEAMKIDRREERTESTLNRIKPFVEHEVIRPMLGQYTKTLDFPGILAGRKILLVNLARQNVISEDNQHLLGTLIVNELITAAFACRPGERKECFLAIDEFSRFVTKDACEILDGGRKFKLHLLLAHQHLGQLKEKDPEVYYSTLTNARTKIVFGGLNDEDVDLISKELFTGEFDPNEVKDEIWHRGFELVESTRTVRGSSSSESSGESFGEVSHSSLDSGSVFIPNSDFWSPPTLVSTSESRSSGSSRSQGSQTSFSSGSTESTVPFYEFHEYRELTSRTFRSLEEQLYLKKAQLKRQPNQHAAVLMPGQNVQLIKVATLRDLPVTDLQCEAFRHGCIETAGCYKTPQEAEAELSALEAELLAEARPTIVVNSGECPGGSPIERKPVQKRASGIGRREGPDRIVAGGKRAVQNKLHNPPFLAPRECASLTAEPIHAGPSRGERMARREFQMPAVLRQESARPYWYIRYRRKVLVGKNEIERKEFWHTLGSCDAITKRQAQRLRDEVMREVNREVYTIQSQILFADFAEIYMKQHTVTLAPGGKKRDLSLIRNHLIPSFGPMKLCDMGTEEVQKFLNAKNGEGLSWWTRKGLHAVVSSIFTKADDWSYRKGRNPARRTTLGRKKAKRERRILTDLQLGLLLEAVPDYVKLMVETAVSTGMRISEILGLRWRAVDLVVGIVKVDERFYRGEVGEPKSERARRILPLGLLTEHYRQHKPTDANPDGFVFENQGEPMDDRSILRSVIRSAAKRLGFYFEGFGWHSFRRQNITVLQEEGATAFEAMAQAGHSRPSMTGEYTIVGLGRREQAVRRLQERLHLGQQPVSSGVN